MGQSTKGLFFNPNLPAETGLTRLKGYSLIPIFNLQFLNFLFQGFVLFLQCTHFLFRLPAFVEGILGMGAEDQEKADDHQTRAEAAEIRAEQSFGKTESVG